MPGQTELVVRGEPVERIYLNYLQKKYSVNRRYQRKLIWTVEEKSQFIDSIIRGLPIPIILLAESAMSQDSELEIIDGMQRLDAITSFISNNFRADGGYFDLNTFATTKDLLDSGQLVQKEPVLPREDCLAISSYPVPLSIYEFTQSSAIDEAFRRINSGGRKLSRQELRAAGALNPFADCVRRISASVRGDVANATRLPLNSMRHISITNRALDYGISAEEVFWVRNGIITKDQLRQSRDEELVADILAYMLSDAPIPSRSEHIDDYFGARDRLDGAELDRFNSIQNALMARNPDLAELDFQRPLDQLQLILARADRPFNQLIFPNANVSDITPRYFQAIFLALHNLIVKKSLVPSDIDGIVNALSNRGRDIPSQEGGRWGAENRAAAVNSVIGLIQNYFEPDRNPDPATVHWITKLQNLLTASTTEQAAYDFKQGFFSLNQNPAFDEPSFERILQTCVAIANIRQGCKGYILVGVSDTPATANRVGEIFGVTPTNYGGFHVTGVAHEAGLGHQPVEQYFAHIANKIDASVVSQPLKGYLKTHMKAVRYFDKVVFVIEILGQEAPSRYGNNFYERSGPQTREIKEVEPENLAGLFARFK